MTGSEPTLGIVFPPYRQPYEMCYLQYYTMSRVIGIIQEGTDASNLPGISVVTAKVQPRTLLGQIVKHSISFTSYANVDDLLAGVDVAISVETSSFISREVARFAKSRGKKTFVVVWETIARHPFFRFPPFSTNTREVEESACGFVAATRRAALQLKERGIEDSRIAVIYPGIDITTFSPRADESEALKTILLYVGKLARHKGFHILLRAFQAVRRHFDVELHVAGDGPLDSLLETELGAGVQYHGLLQRDRLASLYRKASAFVSLPQTVSLLGLKTWEEQFGFTLAEAMASGLPVITTECGAAPEVVGEENQVIKQNSVKEATEALEELLGNPNRWRRVGENNATRARKLFDAEKQSEAFEQFILKQM